MRNLLQAAVALACLCFGTAHATIRYTDAKIVEVETGETQIFVFLQVLSGDTPPLGNGGTNLLPNRPYLTLATTAADIAARKHMLSTALVAYSTGAVVRIRWDDASATPDRVEYLLIRS